MVMLLSSWSESSDASKPEMQPSATKILKHPALVTGRSLALKEKSKEQIWSELSATKMQNSQLLRQLAEERKKPRAVGMPISRRNSAPAPRRKRAASASGCVRWVRRVQRRVHSVRVVSGTGGLWQ